MLGRGSTPFLNLDRISKCFPTRGGEFTVLDGIDLTVGKNEFVSIVGHSGCGKSTLLRIVSGLEEATKGTIELGGISLARYAKERPLAFVFQEPALLPWKTLRQNILLPLEILGHGTPGERPGLVQEAIDLVRLTGFEDLFPDQLSGGMKQRASIARSLVYRPELLLMDEPFGALDDFTRRELSDELLRIWADTASTVLFVTHSLPEAVLLSDKVVVLDSRPGRIREIVDIDLERPRSAELRDSEAFYEHIRYLERLIFSGSKGSSAS